MAGAFEVLVMGCPVGSHGSRNARVIRICIRPWNGMRDNRAFAQLITFNGRGNPPLPHDQHAVRQTDDFRKFGRDDDDRMALTGEIFNQVIDFRLGPDIDSRVGSSNSRICDLAASQRAIIAFAGCRR